APPAPSAHPSRGATMRVAYGFAASAGRQVPAAAKPYGPRASLLNTVRRTSHAHLALAGRSVDRREPSRRRLWVTNELDSDHVTVGRAVSVTFGDSDVEPHGCSDSVAVAPSVDRIGEHPRPRPRPGGRGEGPD